MARTYRDIAIEDMLGTVQEAMSQVVDWWGDLPPEMKEAIEQFRIELGAPLSADAAEWRATMTDPAPRIDFANLPAPAEGILVTLFITVRKVARSRDFYSRVLGGTVVLDENPCMVKLSNSWIIMNPGGPPTPDKPGISVVDYQPGDTTSIFLNLRVADIHACFEEWKAKGAEFVTPPIDRGAEIRCYMRDPDGYLIEVGQSTGLLHGKLAAKRPEDLPG